MARRGRKPVDALIRFLWHVEITPDSCWIWTAARHKGGYGVFGISPVRMVLSHRFIYMAVKGDIPDGCEIHHKCEMRGCCNPDHLEALSRRDHIMVSPNNFSKVNHDKTHCKNGHEFNEGNTWLEFFKDGKRKGRHCRECHRINEAARRERMEAA